MTDLFYDGPEAEALERDQRPENDRCTPGRLEAFLREKIAWEHRWPSLAEIRHQFGGCIGAIVDAWELQRRGVIDDLLEIVPHRPRKHRPPEMRLNLRFAALAHYRPPVATGADDLLRQLRDLGIEPYLANDGTPRLRHAAGKVTTELTEALRANRDDLIRHLTPMVPRRIVLLPGDDRHAAPERVLCEPAPDGVDRVLREQAEALPGRLVAAEWLWRRDGRERWFRWMWNRKEVPDVAP